jgi:hypothetical protein
MINNGKMVSFWLDLWTGDMPLCRKYPILYDLCENQDCSVFGVAREGWVIRFKVRLPPILVDRWYELASYLNTITLNNDKDRSW